MIRVAALAGACLLFLGVSPTGALDGESSFALANDRNPLLTAYTFHMRVALAMRHFPWLHFHIDGDGRYVRGENYIVHFTSMPFFARGMKQIDLSPLDPSIWPKQYTIAAIDRRDGMTTFTLYPLKQDPRDPNPLVEALVTLDSHYSTREVDLRYRSGEIRMNLTLADIQGFRLPASGVVGVNMPGQVLSAQALFTDYTIVQTTP
jgi:hypothetical protein